MSPPPPVAPGGVHQLALGIPSMKPGRDESRRTGGHPFDEMFLGPRMSNNHCFNGLNPKEPFFYYPNAPNDPWSLKT